ncbi:MAG: hypothetical protein AUJ92_06895 [Armatimonadetes bacterium CG2_30_59_28]|nr:MAG: hypothetical protein AUJ92_06895 [Armatimonadetes bacterium CG2_30_59_28]PIU62712.1 MAG: alpha/beta hydrolase [Armatimonadetes bacterium CG07_land_8_20_14_0_80_59_28]PIY37869.1 MAG: alpha/beta hydrolase [Armatimonadetes bacterium CG_4_10_14_3_um_filter_59_10]PJB75054.1 MAG: alpha/beta hydrolase [Armatimonadetes bacterium CG_4_9_14_3_um_filter_58_7]
MTVGATETIPHFPENLYCGHSRHDFRFGENPVIVVEPGKPALGRRWVWRAEFFDAFPAFDVEMLGRGWYLAFISVGNTFGCPSAMRRFDAFYQEMTDKYLFHRQPVLEGLSRGGLYVYNWAAGNPESVGLIYADNPVCDIKSWPGGKGRGPGSPQDWVTLQECYGFQSEAEALAWNKNPVDQAGFFAQAGMPLVHCFGDADEVVPWEENTKAIADGVAAAGGEVKLIVKPGCGHHPHGPADPISFADWVIANARND